MFIFVPREIFFTLFYMFSRDKSFCDSFLCSPETFGQNTKTDLFYLFISKKHRFLCVRIYFQKTKISWKIVFCLLWLKKIYKFFLMSWRYLYTSDNFINKDEESLRISGPYDIYENFLSESQNNCKVKIHKIKWLKKKT